MPKYAVEISDEVSVEFDVAPNTPALRGAMLEWNVPRGELGEMLDRFGGREAFCLADRASVLLRLVPLTRDGELVGSALLRLWVVPESFGSVATEEVPRDAGAVAGYVNGAGR